MTTGKGVLRIAIEDFLESFDPTNFFDNIFGKVARFLNDNVFGIFIEPFEEMVDASKVQPLIDILRTHSTSGQSISKFWFYVFAMASMVSTFGNSWFAPFGQQVTYQANQKALPGRIALADLINLRRKFPNEYLFRRKTAAELGFTEDILNGIDLANQSELDLTICIALYWRGIIDKDELKNRLRSLGIIPSRVDNLVDAVAVIPNVSDLIRMAVRESFSPDVINRFKYDEAFPDEVLKYTKQVGLSDDWVKRYWYAHWELPSPQMGYEMLHRLRPNRTNDPFTADDLDLLLRTADFAPYFRSKMKAISYNPITRVDIRRIYKEKIFDKDEVKERYMDIGYNEKDAQVLADFTVKYEDAQGNDVRDKYKDLSFTVLRSLYLKSKLSKAEVTTRLQESGYDDVEVGLILQYFDLANVDSGSSDYKSQFIAEMIKYVSDAYQVEMIDKASATNTLRSLGLSDANIDYILQKSDYVSKLDILNVTLRYIHDAYVSGALSRNDMIAELGKLGISGTQQNRVIEQMELDRRFPNKRLTETQYRTATIAGLITKDDYKARLADLGYAQIDIDLLVKLYIEGGT